MTETSIAQFRLLEEEMYDRNSEAYTISKQILQRFADEVVADGSIPLVVFFPNISSIGFQRETGLPRMAEFPTDVCKEGLYCLDLHEVFLKIPEVELNSYFNEHHYSKKGNELVAATIRHYLKTKLVATQK
jgi:hypothetical protein